MLRWGGLTGLILLGLTTVSPDCLAQAPKGDFLCVGINAGTANYPGRPASRGGGLSLTGDVYVTRNLSASAAFRFNGYQSENATQIWN